MFALSIFKSRVFAIAVNMRALIHVDIEVDFITQFLIFKDELLRTP